MHPFSIMALFCEDIRPETKGTESLVGILPDTVEIGSVPGMMPKLGVYLRVQFEDSSKLQEITTKLVLPDNTEIPLGAISKELIEDSEKTAREKGNLFAGVKSTAILGGLIFQSPGHLRLVAKMGDQEFVCAAINIILKPEEATSPTS